MDFPQESVEDARKRLRRVEGQIRGIIRMLDEKSDCRDVITQLSAAQKALEQAGFKLLASGLTYCLAEPEKAAETGYGVEEVEKLFMRLR